MLPLCGAISPPKGGGVISGPSPPLPPPGGVSVMTLGGIFKGGLRYTFSVRVVVCGGGARPGGSCNGPPEQIGRFQEHHSLAVVVFSPSGATHTHDCVVRPVRPSSETCCSCCDQVWAVASYALSDPQHAASHALSTTTAPGKPLQMSVLPPAPHFQGTAPVPFGPPYARASHASHSAAAAAANLLPTLPSALTVPPALASAFANVTPVMLAAACLATGIVLGLVAKSCALAWRMMGAGASLKEQAKEAAEDIMDQEVKEHLTDRKVEAKDITELSDEIYKTEKYLEQGLCSFPCPHSASCSAAMEPSLTRPILLSSRSRPRSTSFWFHAGVF